MLLRTKHKETLLQVMICIRNLLEKKLKIVIKSIMNQLNIWKS